MQAARTYSSHELAHLLAAALGEERAHEVIASARKALAVAEEDRIDHATSKRILTYVSSIDGLIGITGRVALSRFQYGVTTSSGMVPVAATRAELRPLRLVTELLSPNLGEDRAHKLVEETATLMNLPDEVALDQALALLEKITRMSGVVGVAARFAKTRIHLSW